VNVEYILDGITYRGIPLGPFDPFEDGSFCMCVECVHVRDTFTRKQWIKLIGGGYITKSEVKDKKKD